MSQLVTAPFFDCACECTAAPVMSNPVLFYQVGNGDPNLLGLIPPMPGVGALCAEANGNGPMYVWNPNTSTWN